MKLTQEELTLIRQWSIRAKTETASKEILALPDSTIQRGHLEDLSLIESIQAKLRDAWRETVTSR